MLITVIFVRRVIEELVTTEEVYIRDLHLVVEVIVKHNNGVMIDFCIRLISQGLYLNFYQKVLRARKQLFLETYSGLLSFMMSECLYIHASKRKLKQLIVTMNNLGKDIKYLQSLSLWYPYGLV